MSVTEAGLPRRRFATLPRRSFRSRMEIFATAAVLAAAAALACLGLLRLTGHSVVVHRGDVLITRAAEAKDVRPGDVVAFSDPTRAGRSTTQRVVSITGDARLELVTRANGAEQEWAIAPDGTVGKLRATVPGAGGVDWRIVLVVLPLLYLGVFALRRIWSS